MSPEPQAYMAKSVGEIYDLIGSMILWAPTFVRPEGYAAGRDMDSDFHALIQGLGAIRKQIGDERYGKCVDLASRARALFEEDQGDDNGKTDQGRALLYEIEDVIKPIRSRRSVKS